MLMYASKPRPNGKRPKDSDFPYRTKASEGLQEKAKHFKDTLRLVFKVSTSELNKLDHAKAEYLLQELDSKVSITFDGWTALVVVCFMAVTVHWINNDWELEKALLAFDKLKGSHSGENLAEELYQLFDQFGLKDKVLHAVGDNLQTNDKALRLLGNRLTKEGIPFVGTERRGKCVFKQ
jgi:hypothetical protein